jgi:hypothetical protein
VDISNKKRQCEDRELKQSSSGLPVEGKRQWCSGCAKEHAGTVHIGNKNKTSRAAS